MEKQNKERQEKKRREKKKKKRKTLLPNEINPEGVDFQKNVGAWTVGTIRRFQPATW